MVCVNCGQIVGDGIVLRFIHDTEDCPNKKFKPLPKEITYGSLIKKLASDNRIFHAELSNNAYGGILNIQ